MSKKLSVMFICLLFFQTIMSGFALPSYTIAKGIDDKIITGTTITDAEGNPIHLKETKEGETVHILVDWSIVEVELNQVNKDTVTIPTELLIQHEQNGSLSEENPSAGIYQATTDGAITVHVEKELESIEKKAGSFVIEALVAPRETEQKEQSPEKKDGSDVSNQPESEQNAEPDSTQKPTPAASKQSVPTTQKASFSSANTAITENIITDITLYQRLEDGTEKQELTPGQEIELVRPYNDFKVTLEYKFALPNNHGYSNGSTYTITIPEQIKVQPNPEPTELRTSNGNTVFGTFTSNNNNEIIIEFNEEIEGNSEISGFISLESEFDQHFSDGNAEQEIKFPISDGSEVTYPVKFIPEGSSISKKADADQPYNTKEITWTVDFNKDLQKLNNAQLHDTLIGNHHYMSEPIKVYELKMNIDGTIASATPLADNQFGSSFPLSLGTIDKAYRIEYKTKIDESDTGNAYKNNVALHADELSSPLNAQATVHVKRGQPLEKTNGAYNKEKQEVEWIVKYNFDERFIPENKAILTDVLQGNHALIDDSFEVHKITINQQTGAEASRELVSAGNAPNQYTVHPTSNGFTLEFNNAIDHAYEIKYKTKAVDRPGETENSYQINNTINDEFGNSKQAKTTISQQIFFKSHSGVDYKDKKVRWNIRINEDKQTMENVTFTDTLPVGFTIENGITVTHGGTNVTEGSDYTLTYNESTRKINIVFLNAITDVVHINYTTTFNYDAIITDQGENRSQNHTNAAGIEWDIEHSPGSITTGKQENGSTFRPDQYSKQNGFKNGTYNPVSKEISWEIGVNYNKETLNNTVIEDVIQGNQNFDLASVKVYEMELTGSKNGVQKGAALAENMYTIEPIEDQGETIGFKVVLNNITEPYLIEYKTDLNGLLVKSSYGNKAVVNSENKEPFDLTATVSPYEGGNYTDKFGEQNEDNPRVVNWSVDINRAQSKINNLVLHDELSKNQSLRKDSIMLYGTKVNTNPNSIVKDESNVLEEGIDYTVAFSEREDGSDTFTISFNNPVEAAYVLEYDSYILYKGTGEEGNFKNNFTLNGEGTESVSSTDPFSRAIDVSKIQGGITGEVGALIVTKVDADNQASALQGATFELYDGDNNFIKREVTDAEGKITFKNLLYDRDYTLKETEAPDGYVVSNRDGYTFKFTKSNEEINIQNHKIIYETKLTKVDEADKTTKLAGATFDLYQEINGEFQPIKEGLTTNAQGVIYEKNLQPGTYQFVEKEAPAGYLLSSEPIQFTIDEQEIETVEVTAENKAIERTSITGSKTWNDGNAEDRPKMIKVDLLQNGEVIQTKDVTEDDNWQYSFDDLLLTNALGEPYTYTIQEQQVDGYKATANEFDIMNVRLKHIEVTKEWLDDNSIDRPDSITVYLLQNGEKIDTEQITAANDWTHTFSNLEAFDVNGKAYEYTIEEAAVDGYKTVIDGFNITNVRVGETEVTGTKTWKDDNSADRPKKIQVNLLQNGVAIDTKEVTADSEWKYSFTSLDKYDDNGVVYEYTIEEEGLDGYKTLIDGFDLINVRFDTTSIDGKKTWKGDTAVDRPKFITVILNANGKQVDRLEVTEQMGWSYSFANIPVYDEEGKEISYSIEEVEVPGYETEIDGFDITNTFIPSEPVEKNTEEDTKAPGAQLPKTATTIYNSILGGIMMILAGFTVLYVRRKSTDSDK
ncbi:Cna B-type domain-containing protein [Virgibacillus sp. W0430]|uniref:Cna B-type domain-containing protein n=1 Tax=Virgibacillus sp. W0430 TaxID=3391580 RepID=UPI003F459D10